MLGWLVRGALIAGGLVAGWFVSREADIYPVASMIAALLIMTGAIALVSFWPAIRHRIQEVLKKDTVE